MSRKLTINQTYHVNGVDIIAQLDPNVAEETLDTLFQIEERLTLFVQDSHESDCYHRLCFSLRGDRWIHESGQHPNLGSISEWANLDPGALCNGLY